MRIQALSGISVAPDDFAGTGAAKMVLRIDSEAIEYPSRRPPPAAPDTERKNRRETFLLLILLIFLNSQGSSEVNRFANTLVGAAATEVAAHRICDIRITWFRILCE